MNFINEHWGHLLAYLLPLVFNLGLGLDIIFNKKLAEKFNVKNLGGVYAIWIVGIIPVFNILVVALAIFHYIETDAKGYLKHSLHSDA